MAKSVGKWLTIILVVCSAAMWVWDMTRSVYRLENVQEGDWVARGEWIEAGCFDGGKTGTVWYDYPVSEPLPVEASSEVFVPDRQVKAAIGYAVGQEICVKGDGSLGVQDTGPVRVLCRVLDRTYTAEQVQYAGWQRQEVRREKIIFYVPSGTWEVRSEPL